MKYLIWLYLFLRMLFSGYTAPNTAAASATISASAHNTYIRDNISYLFGGRPKGQVHYVGAADKTTTSTSWSDVDSVNLTVSVTVSAGENILIFASGRFAADNTASSAAEVDIAVDGTRIGHSTHGMARISQNTTQFFSIMGYKANLSAGGHTITLQFRNVTGGATTTVHQNGFPVNLVVLAVG